MLELSRKAYLEDVLFGKQNSKERAEITSFIERACAMSGEELTKEVNEHLKMKMFLVGQNITAADIIVALFSATHIKDLMDHEKREVPHAFRWIDHIQHLPGLGEQMTSLGLFVSFPEEEGEMSKGQLKKLEKLKALKAAKEAKAAGPKGGDGAAGKGAKPNKEGAADGGNKGPAEEEKQGEKPKKQKQQQQNKGEKGAKGGKA
jgi:hypothetical protein